MEFMLVTGPADSITLSGDLGAVPVPLPGISWDREVAVVVDMGEQRTGGYGVKVTGIRLAEADEVHLTLEVVTPPPGAVVAQVITHPYAVTRLPRVGLRSGPIQIIGVDQHGREIGRQVVEL